MRRGTACARCSRTEVPLGGPRLRRVGRQPEIRDRLRDIRGTVLLAELQALERGGRDALGVVLEVTAERGARVAAAEAVGAERDERLRHPARDLIGNALQVVARGDDRQAAAEDLRD